MASKNTFGAAKTLTVGGKNYTIYSLRALEEKGITKLSRLPYSIRVLLENIVRNEDGVSFKSTDAEYVGKWDTAGAAQDVSYANGTLSYFYDWDAGTERVFTFQNPGCWVVCVSLNRALTEPYALNRALIEP
jgi:hypothetical protein